MKLQWLVSTSVMFRTALCLAIALAAGAAAADEVAYVTDAGELRVVAADGSRDRSLTVEKEIHAIAWRPAAAERTIYSWPTWSPDGERVLAFGAFAREGRRIDGLYVFEARSTRVLAAYEAPDIHPIYAYWSPDGRRTSILGHLGSGLRLSLWPAVGQRGLDAAIDGMMPFFWSWRGDGRALLLHIGKEDGATVTRMSTQSRKRERLTDHAAGFGAPAWSADGRRLAYAEAMAPGRARIRVLPAEGSVEPAVHESQTPLAMSWSPTKSELAVSTSGGGKAERYDSLVLVAVDDAGRTRQRSLLEGPFEVFFWSPRGDRILYASADRGSWAWWVLDVATGRKKEVTRFIPAEPYQKVFLYFDQYALSHRLWSPDGKRFVFCGLAGDDIGSEDPARPRVYVADVDGDGPPRQIGAGSIAFWSPRALRQGRLTRP